MFIVGHLRGTSKREVFPIRGTDEEIDNEINVVGYTKPSKVKDRTRILGTNGISQGLRATDYKDPVKIMQVGNIDQHKRERNNPQTGRVYDVNGISPSLTTMQGGNRQPKVVLPVLTPDREDKRQNGRRFKEDGEPMFTLTSQDKHGTAIREATKQGYDIAYPGDSVNYSVPNSQTRRGRVGKQVANTLDTGCQQGVITDDIRIRKLTPKECWRLQGFPDWTFDKAAEVVSDSQLYKQAGNSVTVNVVCEIGRRL